VLHSTFDPAELAREKKVVLEELYMRRDQPTTKLYEELMARAYTRHPYRKPIIGTEASVSSFTRDDIQRYMAKHYQANNLTVVVVGDVKYDEVRTKVAGLMGALAKGNGTEPSLPGEPVQRSARLFVQKENVQQGHMAVALPIPAFASADTAVLDVISMILGQGQSSRLYHQLRDQKGLVYRIDASAFTPRDPGLLEVTATLEPGKCMAVLAASLEEIFKLKYVVVDDDELERAKRNLESDFIFNLERVEGQARVLGSFQFLTGDPREDEYLAKVRAVTRDDIVRVASAYFLPGRINAGFLVPGTTDVDLDPVRFKALIAKADQAARQAAPSSLVADAFLNNVHRFVLPNGIKLVVRENPEVPTVAIRVVFPGGLRGETVATNGDFAFVSELLSKGTAKMSARDVAVAVADMAGELSGFNGKNTFGVKADFLARFLEPGMALVRDVIRTPAFDPAEAEKVRPELLAQLKQQEDSLPSLAFREFNRVLFQGHPYGLNTVGSEEVLAHVSAAQLKELYEQNARPDRMVIAVVGDVKAEQVRKVVGDLFGDWRTGGGTRTGVEEILPPEPPASPEIRTIERDKEQVHLIVGFLGTSLTAVDRYPLEILDTALSGQSGRLFTELRDKQSLAYSLSSFSLLGLDTGSFGIYIGTSPDKKSEAVKAVWQELYRVREDLLSEAELRKAKNVVIGHYELGLQTHSAQALEAALDESYGLGLDFGNRYVKAIEQVTAEEVREIARKYIQPDHYLMISVGAKAAPEAPVTTETGAASATGAAATEKEK
ncbi:MAG: insulinase family protein, partial [Desulfobulbaceae bacterium]|nr:insulinase family protein [Desulfobulbaceae bacterium]